MTAGAKVHVELLSSEFLKFQRVSQGLSNVGFDPRRDRAIFILKLEHLPKRVSSSRFLMVWVFSFSILLRRNQYEYPWCQEVWWYAMYCYSWAFGRPSMNAPCEPLGPTLCRIWTHIGRSDIEVKLIKMRSSAAAREWESCSSLAILDFA